MKNKSALKGVRVLHSKIQKIVGLQNEAERFTLRHAALLAFVMASGFLIVSQIYMVIPLLNDIVAHFDVTPARATLVSSVFTFAYAVGFLVFGPLSDRLGRKRVLVCGLIVTALATCIVAVMPSFGLLLVARAFQGFASSAFPPAALSSITEELPEQYRPFGVSLISFAFLGAAPLAQFVAAQLPGGPSTIMFQFVPLYLIGAAGLFFTLRSPRNYDSAKNTGMRAGKTSLFRDARTVAAWMAAGTVLFGFVTFHAGAQALGPGINVDLQTLRLAGLPPLLFTFAAALVTRRYGAPATALLGLTVAAIALIVATIATPNIIIAASILLSAGVAFAVPGLIATVAGRATNANRGLSLAIYTFLLFIGASIAPPVAQTLAQFGPMPVWLLPAALFAVGALGLALSGSLQIYPKVADKNEAHDG